MEHQQSSSFRHRWQMVKEVLFLGPIIWLLTVYDTYWAAKFRRLPDNKDLARSILGDSSAPIPLPRKRPRTLSNPLPPLDPRKGVAYNVRRSKQHYDDQAISLFLTKLPLEVRQLVYEEVLAGGDRKLVHILPKNKRLGHWRCRLQNGEEECDSQSRRCVEGWLSYRRRVLYRETTDRLDILTDTGLLSLLLTCRRMQVSSKTFPRPPLTPLQILRSYLDPIFEEHFSFLRPR